ncbi:Basement membrane proteoglycan [Toxocara canis]|uniref:Basement membrane proteoglycan n=1 Tax=Toxocara canis TaxID=6265 RepID=A0A0B2UP16_TOXCA|nr:Basement membrane proteoglycan [Toxocara canis]
MAKAPSVEPPTLSVKEGEPVTFRCWLPENENAELHWRRADGNPLGYGVSEGQDGTLSTPTAREVDAGEYICSAIDPESGYAADSTPVQLSVGKSQRPEVEPPEQFVNEGDPVRFQCFVPGNARAQLRWSREGGGPLPYGVTANGDGVLYIPNAQLGDAGNYLCSTIDPERGEPIESTPARLVVHARKTQTPSFH